MSLIKQEINDHTFILNNPSKKKDKKKVKHRHEYVNDAQKEETEISSKKIKY